MAQDDITPCSLLLIGGSAGSLDVLLLLLPCIKIFNGPIVLVLHRKAGHDNTLQELLGVRVKRPVKEAEEKEELQAGYIYIAPPDYHLLIEKDRTFSLDFSERVNYSRPSIDVTFETAADAYGAELTGLLLSGANSDGAAGMRAIQAAGGRVLVQDPQTAEVSYMPEQALEELEPERLQVLSPEALCQAIDQLPQPASSS